MKKFLGVMLGVLLIGSFTVTKAHAFTLDDLMSQVASLRAEVGQLKGRLSAQVIGADGTLTKDSTSTTGTVSTASNTTTTSFANPTSPWYWVMLEGSNECIAVKVMPTKGYRSCLPPTETLTNPTGPTSTGTTVNPPTDPSFAPGIGYWIKTENGSCVWTLKRTANSVTCAGSESFGNTSDSAVVTKSAPTVKTLSYGQKQSVDVVNLQVALKSAGFFNSTPNGSFGPATRAAVMAVQKAKGLPVTGVADVKTVAAIDVKDGAPAVGVNTAPANTDKFIANLPKLIAYYQSILQNPEAFKSTAKAAEIQQTAELTGRAASTTTNTTNGHCVTYSGGYGSYTVVCE